MPDSCRASPKAAPPIGGGASEVPILTTGTRCKGTCYNRASRTPFHLRDDNSCSGRRGADGPRPHPAGTTAGGTAVVVRTRLRHGARVLSSLARICHLTLGDLGMRAIVMAAGYQKLYIAETQSPATGKPDASSDFTRKRPIIMDRETRREIYEKPAIPQSLIRSKVMMG
ncbi:hypothetical protein PG985_016035 [Apiospora marii]|uniref:Uncharacterized protein n=1 Tax=Apiospora marii TaxID=335849 RepID=A0ABR1S507_9PEZI